MAAAIELHIDDVHNPPPPMHKSGAITAWDEETGLPIVRRTSYFSTTNEGPKHEENQSEGAHSDPRLHRQEGGKPDTPERVAGRDVLHQSTDRAELVRQAKDYARQFENGLKASTQGVKGARVESVRDHKNDVRLDEKIEKEGQPVETIPDILAGRIEADSHEAHEKAANGVRQNFQVVRDIDEFKDGDPDFHYRAHKLQVQVTPQLSGEVHIVPKEVLQAGFEQHADYQKAREADLEGDGKAEKQATAVARRINDQAMKEFEERNAEMSYKFGSTQANIPKDSEAHRAVRGAQAMVDDRDLMGDGKDIDDPHATVRYGIQGEDTSGIRKYLNSQKPFTAKLGKTSAFPPTKNSDGAAVIVAHVESPDLHRMNAEIEKHGDFKKSDFPDYKPHVTIAYVKPETAHKYVGMDVTEGKRFDVHSIAISNRDGEKAEVPLQGKMDAGVKDAKQGTSGAVHDNSSAQPSGPGKRGETDARNGSNSQNGSSPAGSRFVRPPQRDSGTRSGGVSRIDDAGGSTGSIRDGQKTAGTDAVDVRSASSSEKEVSDGQRTGAGTGIDGNSRFKRSDLPSPMVARGSGRNGVSGDRQEPDIGVSGNTAQIRKGVTVLVGSSHGIVRGGNPNFGSDGRWSVETPEGVKTFKGSELTPIASAKPKEQPYIAVDFDKTLAHDDGWKGPTHTGEPITPMVDRVKQWLKDGKDVRLFTARVADDPKGIARATLEAWMQRHLGTVLPITHEKDRWMESLYDDRARQVEPNTGKVLA